MSVRPSSGNRMATPAPVKKQRLIRILIADDHPVVREGLAALIGRNPDMKVISEGADGEQAVQQFFLHQPDLILLDLRMPKLDGVGAIHAIRAKAPDARIILLTTYDGDEDIYRALRAGAKAYLLKDCPRDTLIETIRAVYNGGSPIQPHIAAKLAARVSTPTLSPREIEVMQQIAAGKSNKEIGAQLNITEGTVKSHVTRLLEKLNVKGRSEAISVCIQRGILHLGEK